MTRLRATLRPVLSLALRLPDATAPLAVAAVPSLEARLLPVLRGPRGDTGLTGDRGLPGPEFIEADFPDLVIHFENRLL
jgi:hypothetical protein